MEVCLKDISHVFSNKEYSRICPTAFNMFINKGEYHCLVGESGSGKSTIMNITAGMLKPKEGFVLWGESDVYGDMKESERLSYLNHTFGYMMQGTSLLNNLNTYENVCLPAELTGRSLEVMEVEVILRELGIWNVRNSYPYELSGGEYRRANLARALILRPPILLADEPTDSLDSKSARIVREILWKYYEKGNSVVVATHDMNFLKEGVTVHYL